MIRARALLAAFVAFIAAAPFILSEFHVALLNYIALATMVSLGLVLLTGVAGVMSFGQQVFAGIAAYTTAVVATQYGGSPWLGLVLALGLVAVVALFLGAITLRLSGHYLPISTLAWGIAIYFMFGNLEMLGKYTGISDVPRLAGPLATYYFVWAATLGLLVASANLLDSRVGRAIRALRFRAVMAESFGVDVLRLKTIVFLYAALLAGLSGWLYAHYLRFVSPSAFNVNAGIDYLFMAVIGGASHVWGAVIGASVLTFLKEYVKGLVPSGAGSSGNYEIVVFGVLMMLLLHRAPSGLAPVLARWTIQPPRRHIASAPPLERRSHPAAGAVLLEVKRIAKRFGGLVAVRELSFDMSAGEILGVIGPNGARQEHAVQPDHRSPGRRWRRDRVPRRTHRRSRAEGDRAARCRAHLPACESGGHDVAARERRPRRAPARSPRHGARLAARGARRGGPAPRRGGAPGRASRAHRATARRCREPAARPAAPGGDRPGTER